MKCFSIRAVCVCGRVCVCVFEFWALDALEEHFPIHNGLVDVGAHSYNIKPTNHQMDGAEAEAVMLLIENTKELKTKELSLRWD